MDVKIYDELSTKIDSNRIFINEPMNKHTSFKIGGKADILVKAQTKEEVRYILDISKRENIPLYIIGNGTNILVRDGGIRGIVLIISIMRSKYRKKRKKCKC